MIYRAMLRLHMQTQYSEIISKVFFSFFLVTFLFDFHTIYLYK